MIFKFNVLSTHISAKQLRFQGSVKHSPKSSYIISPSLNVNGRIRRRVSGVCGEWIVVIDSGVGLLNQFPPSRYFLKFSALSKHTLCIEYHVYIWQVSPQPSCGDTFQIWALLKEPNGYFCEIENFTYGEINERSLVRFKIQDSFIHKSSKNKYNFICRQWK